MSRDAACRRRRRTLAVDTREEDAIPLPRADTPASDIVHGDTRVGRVPIARALAVGVAPR